MCMQLPRGWSEKIDLKGVALQSCVSSRTANHSIRTQTTSCQATRLHGIVPNVCVCMCVCVRVCGNVVTDLQFSAISETQVK